MYKLVTEQDAFCVCVRGYIYNLLVVEVILNEVIKVIKIGVCAVRNANNVLVADLVKRQGVHFALCYYTVLLPFNGVDVVGDKLRPAYELETLVTCAEFCIYQLAVAVVVKLYGISLSVLLWHPFLPLCYFQVEERLFRDTSAFKPCKRTWFEWGSDTGLWLPVSFRFDSCVSIPTTLVVFFPILLFCDAT